MKVEELVDLSNRLKALSAEGVYAWDPSDMEIHMRPKVLYELFPYDEFKETRNAVWEPLVEMSTTRDGVTFLTLVEPEKWEEITKKQKPEDMIREYARRMDELAEKARRYADEFIESLPRY